MGSLETVCDRLAGRRNAALVATPDVRICPRGVGLPLAGRGVAIGSGALFRRSESHLVAPDLNVGGSEHCDHDAGVIIVVTDGVIGLRLDDDRVARTGGFLSTVDRRQ